MATLNELFGGNGDFEKRPPSPTWAAVGSEHKAVLIKDPEDVPQQDVGKTWGDLYLEKQPDMTWKTKLKHELTPGQQSNLLRQIVLTVKLIPSGEEATIFFDNKAKKEALKEAMAEGDVDLVAGCGIQMIREKGIGRAWGWSVKLRAPKPKAGA
jgi:hypothetical protein